MMKRLMVLVAAAAAIASAAAAAPAERVLPLGRTILWKPDADPPEVRYRAGEMRIRLERVAAGDADFPTYGPDVTVESPGRAPLTIEGERAGLTFPARLTPGRWNAQGDTFLVVETYTGGAHCCDHVQVAVPAEGRYDLADLGSFDGEKLERLPSDLDRDGNVDFFVRDDRFLYAFGSYAGSLPPPQILNIVRGKVVDVSHRPAFRPLFASEAARFRKRCLPKRRPLGEEACPGYLAASARAGRLAAAWEEVEAAAAKAPPDPQRLPRDCRVALDGAGECPAGEEIVYPSYMAAVRAFLVRHGYISR